MEIQFSFYHFTYLHHKWSFYLPHQTPFHDGEIHLLGIAPHVDANERARNSHSFGSETELSFQNPIWKHNKHKTLTVSPTQRALREDRRSESPIHKDSLKIAQPNLVSEKGSQTSMRWSCSSGFSFKFIHGFNISSVGVFFFWSVWRKVTNLTLKV